MGAISFESAVQAFGAPAAFVIWMIWNMSKRERPVDPGVSLMKDMNKVLEKLDEQSNRITVIEVKLEERTRR